MPGADGGLGKKGEDKVREWLNKPEDGFCFDRIPDQMNGRYGSKNICDFTCFKSPYMYYLECKSTWEDRFDFSMITEYQHDNLLLKSQIDKVYGFIVVLFASYKRAFLIDIREIKRLEDLGIKSLNIKKIAKWPCEYAEIQTIPSRKQLLDYTGDIEIYAKIATGESI